MFFIAGSQYAAHRKKIMSAAIGLLEEGFSGLFRKNVGFVWPLVGEEGWSGGEELPSIKLITCRGRSGTEDLEERWWITVT